MLPFGNIVVTLTVNGAELKAMLENGVSRMPAVDGRFPQVSGLCFTYDIALPAGSRVTGAVPADAAGNCTGAAVDLTAAATYKIAENDFMATGGDGYPNFASRATTQDIMEQVAADYITAHSPLTPFVKAAPNGRINCTDSTGATAPTARRSFRLRNQTGPGVRRLEAAGPQSQRDGCDERSADGGRDDRDLVRAAAVAGRRRPTQQAGDLERLSIGRRREPPVEDQMRLRRLLLDDRRRVDPGPDDAVVAPDVGKTVRQLVPSRCRGGAGEAGDGATKR